METESRIGKMIDGARDWLVEQEWFQQLKGKWDELDAQSRTYAKFGAGGAGAFIFLLVTLSSIWSVQSLKSELNGKMELLAQLQASGDELSRLKGESLGMGEGEKTDWPKYFSERASRAGIASDITVSAEKPGGKSADTVESLFDIQIKHVSIKQVVRLALGLETSDKPIKLRGISIDTKDDPAGYMDATLSVSAFSLVATNK
jgi:hypothetical protein